MKNLLYLLAIIVNTIEVLFVRPLAGSLYYLKTAVFTTTSGIDQIRKSIGGVTFTQTHSAAVMRRRVKPINPRSAAQMTQQGLVKQLSQSYRNIKPG